MNPLYNFILYSLAYFGVNISVTDDESWDPGKLAACRMNSLNFPLHFVSDWVNSSCGSGKLL